MVCELRGLSREGWDCLSWRVPAQVAACGGYPRLGWRGRGKGKGWGNGGVGGPFLGSQTRLWSCFATAKGRPLRDEMLAETSLDRAWASRRLSCLLDPV